MDKKVKLLLGVSIGAGLMYMLDPERGRRRRALVRDQVVHGGNVLEDAGRRAKGYGRDVRNRIRGSAHELRSRLRHEPVDDAVLEARVRSELGRHMDSLDALNLSVHEGTVTLHGPIGDRGPEEIVTMLRKVNGVVDVVTA